MLGFMAVSGIFGLRNLQNLDLSVRFPDEIYCGIPTQLTLQLTSRRSMLPHYLLTLRVNGAAADFQILQPGERRETRVLVTFPARGRGRITKAAVTSPFPVNFFVRSNFFSLDAPYLVFPKPVPLPHGLTHKDPKETGTTSHRRKGSSGETESIGVYTEAEPLKQIHWKLTARHDELLVKEMAAETGKPVIIDLDQLQGGVEERLSHATHLINSLMAEGRAVGLQLRDKTIPPGVTRGHRLKMLGELANHAAD
jgi:uncharacterized protein (DUF58 family)